MWLAGAHGTDDGLLIPGRPTRNAADLCLGPEHVELRAHGATSELSWKALDTNWTIDPWRQRLWPTAGAYNDSTAVHTKGIASNAVAPVLIALSAHTHRLISRDPIRHAFDHGPVVPLHRSPMQSAHNGERTTAWALCRLLATRPELRPRLVEGSRMDRLGSQMAQDPSGSTANDASLKRTTTEILTAMRRAKLTHPLGGRPVPGDRLVPRTEAIDLVFSRMKANPYATGVEASRDQVASLLESHYFRVDPWPFGALTQ